MKRIPLNFRLICNKIFEQEFLIFYINFGQSLNKTIYTK